MSPLIKSSELSIGKGRDVNIVCRHLLVPKPYNMAKSTWSETSRKTVNYSRDFVGALQDHLGFAASRAFSGFCIVYVGYFLFLLFPHTQTGDSVVVLLYVI